MTWVYPPVVNVQLGCDVPRHLSEKKRGLNGDVCQGAIVHTLRVEIGGRSKAKQLTEANTTVQLPRKSYVRTRDWHHFWMSLF